jgi:hypothetical protein
MAVLWQYEGLARPSVGLPPHAKHFNSYCFSMKSSISALSIKIEHPNDPMIKPQAKPWVIVCF